jgi:hypothetical protein
MAFNYSPKTVTDGLILYLDAANTRSYISGSTTWTDLSRSGVNGTLVNGPTFNSANGGSIVFDGTNDYVSIPNSSINPILTGLTSLTVSVWVYVNSYHPADGTIFVSWPISNTSATSPFTVVGLGVTTSGILNATIGNGIGRTVFTSNQTMSLNRWHNIGLLWAGTNIFTFLNGVISTTSTTAAYTLNNSGTANLFLGTYNTNNAYWLNGNYSISSIYNRALSATEIRQNYNATKTRFGL